MIIPNPRVISIFNPQRSINDNRLHHLKMLAALKGNHSDGRNKPLSFSLTGNFTRIDVHLMMRNFFIPVEMIKAGGVGKSRNGKISVYC